MAELTGSSGAGEIVANFDLRASQKASQQNFQILGVLEFTDV
jgi:hypothetical protein